MMELAGILPQAAPTLDNRTQDTDTDVDSRRLCHLHGPDSDSNHSVPSPASGVESGRGSVPPVMPSAIAGFEPAVPPVSVPLVSVPIPQVPPSVVPDVAVDAPSRTEVKLPPVSSPTAPTKSAVRTARGPAAPEQLLEGEEAGPGETVPVEAPLSKSERRRQQQFTRTIEVFEKRLAEAVRTLQKKQEPSGRKISRQLARNMARLESIPVSDPDRIADCLGAIGRSRSPFAVDVLREYTTAGPIAIRRLCIQALGQIDSVSARLGLIALLNDTAPEIVDQAVRCLMESVTVEVVPALVCLGTAHSRLVPVIVAAVEQLDDTSQSVMLQPMLDELSGRNVLCLALALTVLSKVGPEDTLKKAVSLLKHPAAEVRVAAIESMVRAKKKQTVRLFNASMSDPDGRVRSAAATALSSIFSPRSVSLLIAALHDSDHTVRRNAARTLNGMQDQAKEIAQAASKAVADQTDPLTMEYLLEIVGRGGTDDALQTLQRYLHDESGEFRHRAINTLRKLKTRKAAEMLLPFLTDEDEQTRELATRAMGTTGEKSVVSVLRTLLKEDPAEKVRAAAARSLGELKDREAVMDLEESLHDHRLVACQAVIALGSIGQKSALPALLSQLRSSASEIRYHACSAVSELGERANCDLIETLLEDREPMVRRAAEQALQKLGGQPTKLQKTSKKFRRMTQSWLVYVMPSTLSGAIPGGSVGILVASGVLVAGLLSFFAISVSNYNSASYSGPVSYVLSAGLNQDASQVVAIRRFDVLEAWNVDDGSLINRLKLEQKPKAVLAADDEFLIITDEKLFAWNPQQDRNGTSMQEIAGVDVSGAEQIRSLPDGKTIYLIAASGKVDVFGVAERKVSRSFELPGIAGGSLAVSPDQKFIAYGDDDGKLHLCSPVDGKELHNFSAGRFLNQEPGSRVLPIQRIAFSSDGQFMAISFERGSLVLVGMDKLQTVKTLDLPVSQMVFHPRKPSLIVVNTQGLHVLEEDFNKHRQSQDIELGDVRFLQLTPDARFLLSFVDEKRDIWVSDLENLTLRTRLTPAL